MNDKTRYIPPKNTPLDLLQSYEDAPCTASNVPGAVQTAMDALRGYEMGPAAVEEAPMAWQILCWGSAEPNVPPIGQDVLLELIEQGRRVHLVGRFSGWIAATPRRVPLWIVQTPDGPQTLLTPEVHAWHPFPRSTY